jgi:hypothetical protein
MISAEEVDEILETLKSRKGLKKGEIQKLLWKLQSIDQLPDDSVLLEMLPQEKGPLKAVIIQALGKSSSQAAESALLEVLESSNKYFEIYWSIVGLKKCGTSRSVPTLKQFIYYPKTDIKISSLGVIACIAGSDEAQLYVDLLNDKKYPEKGMTVIHIHKYCDDRAVDSVTIRLKALLSRKRGRVETSKEHSEITRILDYLNRHIDKYPSIVKSFENVKKKWDVLYDNEKKFLCDNIAYFKY